MSRTIARSMARKQYDRFSRDWRREKRMAGAWGRPGRKPTFSQWYALHQGDPAMMRESSPSDVQEHLGLDPWVDEARVRAENAVRATQKALEEVDGPERGVMTIPMVGGDAD